MPYPVGESSTWDSPFLLAGPGGRHLIYRRAEGALLWRKSDGVAWTGPAPLPATGESFCAVLDAAQSPHVVVCDKGKFFHLRPEDGPGEGPERADPAIFYRDEEKSCSHLVMSADPEGTLHLIYLALETAADRWWLLHHRYSGESWEEPRVIDFGGGASCNYGAVTAGENNGLHLVYRIKEQEQTVLYYRYFNATTLNWSKAVPVAAAADILYPAVLAGPARHLHVLWCAPDGPHYRIGYRLLAKAGWSAGGWKPEVTPAGNLAEPAFTFFTYRRKEPVMAWLEGEKLCSFRYTGGHWEKTPPEKFEYTGLIRCFFFHPPQPPLFYLLPARGEAEPGPEEDVLPGEEERLADLEPDFDRLQQYSGTLIDRASSLTETKTRLERALEEKKKQIYRLSRENERTVHSLRQSLAEKDQGLQELEKKFNQTVSSLKEKIDRSRQTWETERKRRLEELQALKKEQHQFAQVLKDKETTIARLERRCRELEFREQQLQEENRLLAEQLRESGGWSIKKFLGRLLHNKP